MTRVKICGITTLEDAFIAVEAGADMLGFNFYAPSPRYLTPAACRAITDDLRAQLGASCPLLIGVFVNEPAAGEIVTQAGLDYAQLHGDESPEALAALAGRAFKAIRPRTVEEVAAQAAVFLPHAPVGDHTPALLVDAYHKDQYGGTGERTSLRIAQAACKATPRLLLAGGLMPDNVAELVRAFRPWGVDVASGVEGATKGRKDSAAVQAFMTEVKIADSQA
jgi:phosphoribosylanthranilate isomerase